MKLEILYFGKQIVCEPYCVNGVGLVARTDGQLDKIFIMDYMAFDRKAYWKAWRELGGDKQGLHWESGQPFISPGSQPIAAAGCEIGHKWLSIRFWLSWLYKAANALLGRKLL